MADDTNNVANLNHTRTGIMKVIAPVVASALAGIAGLNMADPTTLRRVCRAIAHLAIKYLLDAGAPPQFVALQLGEALQNEMAERNAAAKAQVESAKETGGAAILTLPVKGNLPN